MHQSVLCPKGGEGVGIRLGPYALQPWSRELDTKWTHPGAEIWR